MGAQGHRALDVDASGTSEPMQGLLGTTLILLAACSLAAMGDGGVQSCPPCWRYLSVGVCTGPSVIA